MKLGDGMLQNMKNIILKTNDYAIPQFNINNLEWTRFILEKCEELKSPVILGVSEGAIQYMGGYHTVTTLVKSLLKDLNITIPVVLHLDHGSSYESCISAIDNGFTSVMIDASKKTLDENIKITKQVVDYAHINNVTVEAEIGNIGSEEGSNQVFYANIEETINLVKNTNVDFLAPALGNLHGLYNGEINLDFNLMKKMNGLINIPLVLHGASGIPDNLIIKSIKNGINKININTELQVEWAKSVRKFLNKDQLVYDPRKIIKSGEEAIKKIIEEKVILFGSNNKA